MNVMPDRNEALLIRAAVGDGEVALAAWKAWREAVDFEHVDGESVRIVPLLYRNLVRLGVPAKQVARYGSVYRHSWAANRLAFLASARALAALREAGIPTLLLKGAALTILHYRDVGVRSMGDVDALVPPTRILEAAAVLGRMGWIATPRERPTELTPAWLATHYSAGFGDDKGREIDLHWYASADARWAGVDDELWSAAVPVEFEGVATLALAPTDLLYNVLAHGYSSFAQHIRWAADATTVIAGAGAAIDWARLVRMSETRRMVLPVRAALSWIRDELGAAVPEGALAALTSARVSTIDRLEFEHRNAVDPYTLDKVLLRHWCWHRRASGGRASAALALGFPAYLGRYYGTADGWKVARLLFARGLARVRRPGG